MLIASTTKRFDGLGRLGEAGVNSSFVVEAGRRTPPKDIHPTHSHVARKVSLLSLPRNEMNAFIPDQVKTRDTPLDVQC